MSDPWFKFYPSDWLSGTRAFTLAETGLYVTLIAMMYDSGAAIAMDRKRLARMCGSTPRAFDKALSALIDAGKIIENDDGLWSNRVQKEMKKRRYIAEKASQAATHRWQKTVENQCEVDADASKAHMRIECLPEARSQKPEAREERKTATQSRAGAPSEVDEALAIYAEVCVPAGMAAVAVVTDKRRSAIRARLKEAKLDGWRKACHAAAMSPFWRGEVPPTDGRPQFKGALDSFVRPENFAKLIEGGFAARPRVQRKFDPNQALFGGPA
jgi:uncharacterized protein YdaU (DUF1376 family)